MHEVRDERPPVARQVDGGHARRELSIALRAAADSEVVAERQDLDAAREVLLVGDLATDVLLEGGGGGAAHVNHSVEEHRVDERPAGHANELTVASCVPLSLVSWSVRRFAGADSDTYAASAGTCGRSTSGLKARANAQHT